jgi:hypothetical protein
MTKLFILILLLIKHSAQENDNAFFGLFFPLIVLIFWTIMGKPFEKFKDDPNINRPYSVINRVRYQFAFIMWCLLTVVGIYRGISYYFFS